MGEELKQPALVLRDARQRQRTVITEERQVVTENGGAGSRVRRRRGRPLLPEVLDQQPTSTTVVFCNDRLLPVGPQWLDLLAVAVDVPFVQTSDVDLVICQVPVEAAADVRLG